MFSSLNRDKYIVIYIDIVKQPFYNTPSLYNNIFVTVLTYCGFIDYFTNKLSIFDL